MRRVDLRHLPHGSKLLFESETIRIGATRCPSDHPDFGRPGPIERHVVYLGGNPVRVRGPRGAGFLASPASASFHNQGDVVEREALDGDGDVSNWLAPSPDWLLPRLAAARPEVALDERRPFHERVGPCPAEVFLGQRILVGALLSPAPPEPLEVEETALALLDALLAGVGWGDGAPEPERPATARRHQRIVTQAQELLLEGIGRGREERSLTEIARALGTSPFHLARVFRRRTGWSLHAYRSQLRLDAALDEVLAGADDLAALAVRLGFASHSHLSTAFKRAFGRTPSALRAAARHRVLRL